MHDDQLGQQQDLGAPALPGQVTPPTYYTNQPPSEQTAPQQTNASAPADQQPTIQQNIPPVQNIYITQQVTQQQQVAAPVFVGAPKSMVASLVLTFFFGPLGMLYSTVSGGLIMIVVSIIVAVVTLGFGVLITWPICMIWGAVAVSQHNARLMASSTVQINR